MKRLQDNIPISTVIRYLKQERDDYKAKLEKLISYTHSLESKTETLEQTVKKLNNQISGLTKECVRNPLYRALMKKYTEVKHDNKYLLQKLGAYQQKEKDYEIH